MDPPYTTAGIMPPVLRRFSLPEEEISLLVAFRCVINFLKNVIYNRKTKKQANYLNKLETDVEFAILFIASDIIGASEIISIFLLFSCTFLKSEKIKIKSEIKQTLDRSG